jgi:hypothetical protein
MSYTASTTMDSYELDREDLARLLCWLTCGCLGAYYLEGTWPGAKFQVEAAHRWLDRHRRSCNWLTTAKLSAIALRLAQSYREVVDSPQARDAIEEIVTADDLNYDSTLVKRIYDDCQVALAAAGRTG